LAERIRSKPTNAPRNLTAENGFCPMTITASFWRKWEISGATSLDNGF